MWSWTGNLTDDVRSSYIMVRSGRQTQRIQVAQDTEGGISLSSDYLPVRYLGASSSLTILNTEFLTDLSVSVEDTETEWCSALIDGDRLFVNTRFNDRTEARSALLTVTGKRAITGETRTAFVTVYQGKGGMTPYVFEIPDFSESQVYKVMDGQKQVAQITREFLRAKGKINAQAVVVYPVENDEVDLSMGYVAQIVLANSDLDDATYTYAAPTGAVHGGSVSFNMADNTLSGYIAGTLAEPVTKIYMPGDVGMGPEEVVGSQEATVVPHVITDVRNAETNVYPIVKIGTQYWMGRHLNTVYYNKNKNFEAIPTDVTTNEADRRKPNYCIYSYNNGASTESAAVTNRERFGLLYPYLTIGGFETVADARIEQCGRSYCGQSFARRLDRADQGRGQLSESLPRRKRLHGGVSAVSSTTTPKVSRRCSRRPEGRTTTSPGSMLPEAVTEAIPGPGPPERRTVAGCGRALSRMRRILPCSM